MTRTAVAYVREPVDPASLPRDLEISATIQEGQGVGAALERIAAGEATALLLTRLGDAAGSLADVVRLLDWLEAAPADLIAADVQLDTATASGTRMVDLLREIDRWRREGGARRRPRGRPGLGAGSPALADRIAELRERGLTLQAIAVMLNQEGVPTPRGGAMWRPSSVQSALGYRRPPPPIPGAPPRPGRAGDPGPGRRPAPPAGAPPREPRREPPRKPPGEPRREPPGKPRREPPRP